jgi:hypothetical protein
VYRVRIKLEYNVGTGGAKYWQPQPFWGITDAEWQEWPTVFLGNLVDILENGQRSSNGHFVYLAKVAAVAPPASAASSSSASAVEPLEGSGSMAALAGVDANKMKAWWDFNGGLAIYGFDPETWASQLSARLAAAKEINEAFKVNFNADLVHMSVEMLRSFHDGFYLVEMKKLVMEQVAPQPLPAAGKSVVRPTATFASASAVAPSAPPPTRMAAKDAAEEALRTAVSMDGRLLHDVPADHYCLYSSLLHAFTTQLPPVHPAHMDAREHMLTNKPAHSFLAAIASSMEANDLLETVWDLEGLGRVDVPTLEKSIVEKAEPADFKRGEGSTVASLLNKMRSRVTKPWGTELILTYFIPSMYDVGVRVLHVDKDGSRADCSEYTLPV